MGLMTGKKGIIFGVSNKRGIAYAIAEQLYKEGAEIAFTYAGEVMKDRVEPIAKEMNSKMCMSCDVTKDHEVEATFKEYKKQYGELHFVVHAVAFANKDDLAGRFTKTTLEGWNLAMSVSAYSLIPVARYARPLFAGDSKSIITLTYYGGEKSVPNYNVMGVAKAALECNVRYLAAELGPEGIRVNALSAGPVKTLAAKGIDDFDILLKLNKYRSPLRRNITLEEVGGAGLYLCSHLSNGVTGETHHVDSGYHSVGISPEDARIIGIDPSEKFPELARKIEEPAN